jgi:hypothetical protein
MLHKRKVSIEFYEIQDFLDGSSHLENRKSTASKLSPNTVSECLTFTSMRQQSQEWQSCGNKMAAAAVFKIGTSILHWNESANHHAITKYRQTLHISIFDEIKGIFVAVW